MDWLWKVVIGCDGIEEVMLRRPSDTPDCSEPIEFFRSPFLVRSVDDEPEFIATGGAAGRRPMSRLAAPAVSLASGLAGHCFAGGRFIDLIEKLEGVTLT